jgi:hypothetical protein
LFILLFGYAIGCASERNFRKINGQAKEIFLENVSRSLSYENIHIPTVWKFERKSRDYMRSYKITGRESTYENVENVRKNCKSHRNIAETHSSYIQNVMDSINI